MSSNPLDSLTIRISRTTHEILRELSESTNMTMAAIVDLAVRDFRRKRFWDDYRTSYAVLRTEDVAWNDYQAELAGWTVTVVDRQGDRRHE